jgi:XTP/dITP diphosphohydrolase
MKLIFATNNRHKIDEIRSAIDNEFQLITLMEAGVNEDIPEPHDTLEANASEKSKRIYELTGKNCFSEDTGLEVEALNGEPGVKSARYAGDEKSFDRNIEKLLSNLNDKTNRRAKFRAIISLIIEGKENLFEGICEGIIIHYKKGKGGFGYDSVFLPDGATHTFAEMDIAEKNHYSHRKKAADKLVSYLKQFELNLKS